MQSWLEKRRVRIWRRNVQPSIWLRMLVILDDTMVQHLFVKETNQQHHSKRKIQVSLPSLAKNLSQSHYILAEEADQVVTPTPKSQTEKAKKNNYDFLKKSQIYNKKSKQTEQERRVAQELNLTRITE